MMTGSYRYEKVLIIDDTVLDCFIADKMMRMHGFAKDTVCINSASTAIEYLDALTDDPAALPELIFVDMNMPGMNGFQFLNAYNRLPDSIKKKSIIMLTSSVQDEDKTRALSNEYVMSFITKPLSKSVLNQLQ